MPDKIVTFDTFAQLELRVGKVLQVQEIAQSQKLYQLIVSFGKLGERTVLAGLKPWYQPEQLVGQQFVFVYNLAPRKMMGQESQGMILAASHESLDRPLLVPVPDQVPAGSIMR